MAKGLEFTKEMNFTILENSSPYYIRFTHEGIDDILNYVRNCIPDTREYSDFKHHRLLPKQSAELCKLLPFAKHINLMQHRMGLFISKPGMYYRAHKDGLDHRFSINYTIKILDDKCITSWYSDEELDKYKIDNLITNTSRECVGFVKDKHKPLKTMVAKQNECILFNTDIFHDWDNTQSNNERIVLTLRVNNPGQMYFDDAKRILFNI